MDLCGFHRFGSVLGEKVRRAVAACGTGLHGIVPLQESFGSLSPTRSKVQGARSKAGSELPGLICIGFHRFSMEFIDFS